MQELSIGKIPPQPAELTPRATPARRPKTPQKRKNIAPTSAGRKRRTSAEDVSGADPRGAALDSGAGLNAIPAETHFEFVHVCEAAGISTRGKDRHAVQLEHWDRPEEHQGIARRITAPPARPATSERTAAPAKVEILAMSQTDWVPITLGEMTIDCAERGGLCAAPRKPSISMSSA